MRLFSFVLVAVLCPFAVASAESIQGSYVEARVVPGSSGSDERPAAGRPAGAVLAWQIRQGQYDGEPLDGQTIVAVVTAEPSPGAAFGHTKTVFVVDPRLTASQQSALVHLAKDLAPAAIHDAGHVVRSKLDVRIAEGCGCGAAVVACELAKFRTRRLTAADEAAAGGKKPPQPLGEVFSSTAAIATEFSFGAGITAPGEGLVTAFVGSFSR